MHNTDTTPTKVQKYAKLGVIPDGWTTPKINEVFQFINTTSFSRNQLNYDADNELFYIHYGDIHATYKKPLLDFEIETNIPRLNKDVELPNTIQYLKDGDVIIADASEDYEGVGEAIEIKNLNGKVSISGLHTFALRDINNKTVAGFRTYIFKNPNVKKALKTIATGSKVYGISKGNIQKFKIVLPPLPEQQKIAQILATWDVAINKQEALIAEKQQQKKALMQQLLTGKRRFPEFTKKWNEVRLGEIGEVISGLTYSPSDVRKEGLLVLRSSNIKNRLLKLEDKVYVRSDIENYNKVLKNDILICVRNGSKPLIGKNIIISSEMENQAFGAFMSVFRSEINEFLFHLFDTDVYRREIHKNLGATINSINTGNLKKFKFNIPSIEESKKLTEFFNSLDNEINFLIKGMNEFKCQKQGLMQQLLTGKIRVKI
mgnify:CR=1 FL=1|tara:strand:- start:1625 stop:2917 length:1293 start_codon:yes stop_codon:yes gene_type:complete